MARTISTGIITLSEGTYQHSVNGFNTNNTDFLILTVDRINWPLTTSDIVMRVSLLWNTGGGASIGITGGDAVDRLGNPLLKQRFRIGVPNMSDGNGGEVKKSVSGGIATVEVLAALTTAFTLTAE